MGVMVFGMGKDSDPEDIAKVAVSNATDEGYYTVLVDTVVDRWCTMIRWRS